MNDTKTACHICGRDRLNVLDVYGLLRRVTSDCRPWPAGGQFATCPDCGYAQAVVNAAWTRECGEIYGSYRIYSQSAGVEQPVFQSQSGDAVARSGALVNCLLSSVDIPAAGTLLDIGCGNGGFLRKCSEHLRSYRLHGTEFDDKYRAEVEAIPGFSGLYVCDLDEIPGTFDLASLVHVLEHIPHPVSFLRKCWERVSYGGHVLIQVPDCRQNPSAIPIADHCSHFSIDGVEELLKTAGFEIVFGSTACVSKEITVIGRKPAKAFLNEAPRIPLESTALLCSHVEWLKRFAEESREFAGEGTVGIFGSSIAGTWMKAELEDRAGYFVDGVRRDMGSSIWESR